MRDNHITLYARDKYSFEERTIGTWDNLQYCVRFWCYLLEWIMNRLLDVPDYN